VASFIDTHRRQTAFSLFRTLRSSILGQFRTTGCKGERTSLVFIVPFRYLFGSRPLPDMGRDA